MKGHQFLLAILMCAHAASDERATNSDPIAPSVAVLARLARDNPLTSRPEVIAQAGTSADPDRCSKLERMGTMRINLQGITQQLSQRTRASASHAFSETLDTYALPKRIAFKLPRISWTFDLLTRTADPANRATHFSGISNDGAVRITVNDKREVVATLNNGAEWVRLLPHADHYDAFKLTERPELSRATPYILASEECFNHPTALELAHVRMLILSDLQPWRANVRSDAHSVLLQGGKLGRLRGPLDERTVSDLLVSLSPLLPQLPASELKIQQLLRDPSTSSVRINFKQTVRGIPIERPNSIDVDGKGQVTEISSNLLATPLEVRTTKLNRDVAVDVARQALAQHAHTADPMELLDANLGYEYQPDGSLVPRYLIAMRTSDGADYWVHVNGESGAAALVSAAME